MFYLLVDTCVWLDVAKDPELQPLLAVMEQLVEMQAVSLVLPQIVLDEFKRNKKRVADDSCRSLSSMFKRVEDAVDKFGDPKKKRSILQHLNDVDHQIPLLGESVVDAIARIERLMGSNVIIPLTDAVKLRAAQRAIEKKVPFHKSKNGIGDAIIIETYADCLRERTAKGTRFAFVTHNKEDFSEPHGDNRRPHPDLIPLFSRIKSLYFISLRDALRLAAMRRSLWAFFYWRRPMRSPSDLAPVTPEQRLSEVDAILAHGLLRLHSRAALAAAPDPRPAANNPPKSSQDCLE